MAQRPARAMDGVQLVGHGGEDPETQFGRCARGCDLTEPAFEIVAHSHSFAI
jgi:hypothetical protein